MDRRLELQALLQELLGSDNVYFQPPENIRMNYPCIVYRTDFILPEHANDKTYKLENRYLVTSIDLDPDSEVPWKVMSLPKCSYDRFYTADNLNHHVFKLFF